MIIIQRRMIRLGGVCPPNLKGLGIQTSNFAAICRRWLVIFATATVLQACNLTSDSGSGSGSGYGSTNVEPNSPPVTPIAPAVNLSTSSSAITSGQSTQLTWNSSNADSCVASGAWSGSKSTQGSQSTGSLNSSSVYTLTCASESASVSDSVTVTVNSAPPPATPPTLTFSATPSAVSSGGTTTLTWDSTNATSCTASTSYSSAAWNGSKSADGNQQIGPLFQNGTFTLNCSGAGGSVARSAAVTVSTAPGNADIPDLALWEQNMVTYGQQAGALLNPSVYNAGQRINSAYYDALYVNLRIMDYTGQAEPWLSYAGWGKQTWIEDRYDRPNYNMVGYHRFSLGMYEDFIRGNPTANAASPAQVNSALTLDPDFIGIRDLGAFAQPWAFVNEYCGSCSNVSRELAYSIVAHVVSERAGLARASHSSFGTTEPRLQTYIRWAGRQMEQWRNASYVASGYQADTNYHQMQPFMTGLTMKALIDFYEWEVENGRNPNAYWVDPTPNNSWPTIVAALQDFTNWLYSTATVRNAGGTPSQYVGQRMWNSSAEGFRYADRYSAYEGTSPDVVSAAPDLNMLIAPAYAWVYKQTGSDTARIQGDAIFSGGVRRACLNCGGKQFNQNYIYSFDYVRWRSQ